MARTGSGKTAAFLLPLFERLKAHSTTVGERAVVLSPTREHALQTHVCARALSHFAKSRRCDFGLLVGGDAMEEQFDAARATTDALIATPGRMQHRRLHDTALALSRVEYLVFDEADRLFEMGFGVQIAGIMATMPDERQCRSSRRRCRRSSPTSRARGCTSRGSSASTSRPSSRTRSPSPSSRCGRTRRRRRSSSCCSRCCRATSRRLCSRRRATTSRCSTSDRCRRRGDPCRIYGARRRRAQDRPRQVPRRQVEAGWSSPTSPRAASTCRCSTTSSTRASCRSRSSSSDRAGGDARAGRTARARAASSTRAPTYLVDRDALPRPQPTTLRPHRRRGCGRRRRIADDVELWRRLRRRARGGGREPRINGLMRETPRAARRRARRRAPAPRLPYKRTRGGASRPSRSARAPAPRRARRRTRSIRRRSLDETPRRSARRCSRSSRASGQLRPVRDGRRRRRRERRRAVPPRRSRQAPGRGVQGGRRRAWRQNSGDDGEDDGEGEERARGGGRA